MKKVIQFLLGLGAGAFMIAALVFVSFVSSAMTNETSEPVVEVEAVSAGKNQEIFEEMTVPHVKSVVFSTDFNGDVYWSNGSGQEIVVPFEYRPFDDYVHYPGGTAGNYKGIRGEAEKLIREQYSSFE